MDPVSPPPQIFSSKCGCKNLANKFNHKLNCHCLTICLDQYWAWWASTSFEDYSGDPNTGRIRYSNFWNSFGYEMVQFSKTGQKTSGFWMFPGLEWSKRMSKHHIFKCFRYSNVRYLDCDCITFILNQVQKFFEFDRNSWHRPTLTYPQKNMLVPP